MKPEDRITELYQKADFDKNDSAQKRVYSKINKSHKAFSPIWLFAPAAALFALVLFWPGNKTEMHLLPAPHLHEDLSQQECVDLSTRYWFEQAAQQSKTITAKCPKELLGDYNNNVISQFQQHLEKSKLSQDEKRKLDDCDEKFKVIVHPVISYDLQC